MQCNISIRRPGDNHSNITRAIRAYRCSIRANGKRARFPPVASPEGKKPAILLHIYVLSRWTSCERFYLRRLSLQSRGPKGSRTIGRSSVSLSQRGSRARRGASSLSSREEVRVRRETRSAVELSPARKESPLWKKDAWKVATEIIGKSLRPVSVGVLISDAPNLADEKIRGDQRRQDVACARIYNENDIICNAVALKNMKYIMGP